jgi:hypothetical protein
MRVGPVKSLPVFFFLAFSLMILARVGPEPGSRWSARSEARTNDLVRRRGSVAKLFNQGEETALPSPEGVSQTPIRASPPASGEGTHDDGIRAWLLTQKDGRVSCRRCRPSAWRGGRRRTGRLRNGRMRWPSLQGYTCAPSRARCRSSTSSQLTGGPTWASSSSMGALGSALPPNHSTISATCRDVRMRMGWEQPGHAAAHRASPWSLTAQLTSLAPTLIGPQRVHSTSHTAVRLMALHLPTRPAACGMHRERRGKALRSRQQQ